MTAPAPSGIGGSLLVIDFSERGNSRHFQVSGWSGQEPGMVWGIGGCSVIRATVPSFQQDLILEAEIDPCRHPPLVEAQLVRIAVNGHALGYVRLERRSMIRCRIDHAMVGEGGALEIGFGFPGFLNPAGLRFTSDTRLLSGAFFMMRIYTDNIFGPDVLAAPSRPEIPVLTPEPPVTVPIEDAGTLPARMMYTFGEHGSAAALLREGWAPVEERFTWTKEQVCSIALPALWPHCRWALKMDVEPFVTTSLPLQELTVIAEGLVLGQLEISEPTTFLVPLPPELVRGVSGPTITLVLPDARRPRDLGLSTDPRLLGLAFYSLALIPLPAQLTAIEHIKSRSHTPLPLKGSTRYCDLGGSALTEVIEADLQAKVVDVLKRFESLGDNCEFGIAQRKLGLEVFNLFRFGNTSLVSLMRALADELRAVADASAVSVQLNDDGDRREFLVELPAYGIRWHTFTYEEESDAATILKTHAVKLGYLRRKFFEGLESGRKIYVLKRAAPVPLSQASALLLELSRIGRATLLCVELVRESHRAGEVVMEIPGLMRGYVGGFAPENDVVSAEPTDWLRLVGNAMLVMREAERPAAHDA